MKKSLVEKLYSINCANLLRYVMSPNAGRKSNEVLCKEYYSLENKFWFSKRLIRDRIAHNVLEDYMWEKFNKLTPENKTGLTLKIKKY